MALTWWNDSSDAIVFDGCTFEGNPSPWLDHTPQPTEGGGLMAENNVNVQILRCCFLNNFAEAGGGIHSYRAISIYGTRCFRQITRWEPIC